MQNYQGTQTKLLLKNFIEESRADSLYDQLIGTLELQDLNKKLLTVFLDIDSTLMAYSQPELLVKFCKEFSDLYEHIPDIVSEIVKSKIIDYAESEELKKIALYHLENIPLHVELKISHFPEVYENISTKMLSVNNDFQKNGSLA